MKSVTINIDQELQESLNYLQKKTLLQPKIGLILGSGLGDFADRLQERIAIPTTEIPHYPKSTVKGHKGNLVFGKVDKVPVLVVQGRTHYYEGHPIQKVAYVVRLMSLLGIGNLIVTNAAGGVNPRFSPGDLMVITDHINFFFQNPLIGKTVKQEIRFPDLHDVYHPSFVELIETTALELKIPLKKGVLFASTGSGYETAAEVKMIAKLGGDAASMSTVPEVLVARANGIKVAGISCITNKATGISLTPLTHNEVTEIANQVKPRFQMLLKEVILKMDLISP